VEGYADDEGLNSHGDLPHCSPSDSILERDLSRERVFINPPMAVSPITKLEKTVVAVDNKLGGEDAHEDRWWY
jgi:hypothetical protein